MNTHVHWRTFSQSPLQRKSGAIGEKHFYNVALQINILMDTFFKRDIRDFKWFNSSHTDYSLDVKVLIRTACLA